MAVVYVAGSSLPVCTAKVGGIGLGLAVACIHQMNPTELLQWLTMITAP